MWVLRSFPMIWLQILWQRRDGCVSKWYLPEHFPESRGNKKNMVSTPPGNSHFESKMEVGFRWLSVFWIGECFGEPCEFSGGATGSALIQQKRRDEVMVYLDELNFACPNFCAEMLNTTNTLSNGRQHCIHLEGPGNKRWVLLLLFTVTPPKIQTYSWWTKSLYNFIWQNLPCSTLPETNTAPKNWRLGDDPLYPFFLGKAIFRSKFVRFREGTHENFWKMMGGAGFPVYIIYRIYIYIYP